MKIYVYIIVFLAALLLVFVLQNATPVFVTFGFWQIQMSLSLIILLSIVGGALLMLAFVTPSRLRKRKELQKMQQRYQQLERNYTITPKKL